jgi:methylisocitrate lyase
LQSEGLRSALARGDAYLAAGADGIYIEGPRKQSELEKIGAHFRGCPLATSVLENGGKTPFLAPEEFGDLGYAMVLYPTTLLFSAAAAIRDAAERLRAGRPLRKARAVNMVTYQRIVDLPYWQKMEKRFQSR